MNEEFKIGDKIYPIKSDTTVMVYPSDTFFTINKIYTILKIDVNNNCWIKNDSGEMNFFPNTSYEKFLKEYCDWKCEKLERKYKLNKLFKNEANY